jgi:CDP-glucose 4,6-dehydratase
MVSPCTGYLTKVRFLSMRYAGKSVLVTGHTGFKGGWLALWLSRLGATVHGYALDPPTGPSFFEASGISSLLASDTRADITDAEALKIALNKGRPEVIFHLAAQPLVRFSYCNPLQTMATNIMGTVNVLNAARTSESVRAIVAVTSDKVYENREWQFPYRESDALGGHDPYSASKAAAEVVAASYRASFFSGDAGHPARVATARAGNVIGGGDWASDRLVPDCIRAFVALEPVHLRFPGATRPWQHVLEPLSGYLQLAERLLSSDANTFARAWNFGPDVNGDASVGRIADTVAHLWGADAQVRHAQSARNPHEAGILRLDSTLARTMLGWRPMWKLDEALAQTVGWYRAWERGADMAAVSLEQIAAWEKRSGDERPL